jgi:hypothetical protein
MLNTPYKWLNLKKKHLHRSKKHYNDLNKPIRDISKRLIVDKLTIGVLLDTGSSCDLLFVGKGSDKYIPSVKRATTLVSGLCPGADNQGPLPLTTNPTQNLPNLRRTLV